MKTIRSATLRLILILGLAIFGQNFIGNKALASSGCENLQSARVDKLLEIFNQDLQSPAVWADYHPARFPMLILDLKVSGRCVFVIKVGQILAQEELKTTFHNSITGYTFIANPKYYPKYPAFKIGGKQIPDTFDCCVGIQADRAGLEAIVKKYDFKAAHIHWWTSFDKADPNEWRNLSAGLFATLVHEAFHFLYQNRGLSQKPWPNQTMITGAVPGFVQKQCYGYSTLAGRLLLQESTALINAYINMANKAEAKKYLREFVALRKQRYANAPKFPSKGRPYSHLNDCEKLEAQMEYHEGVPHFNGLETSLRAGLYTRSEVLGILRESMPTPKNPQGYITINYGFGGLQLMVLEELLGPQKFNELTQRLTKNKVADNFANSIAQAIK